jgi:hypothetical protein
MCFSTDTKSGGDTSLDASVLQPNSLLKETLAAVALDLDLLPFFLQMAPVCSLSHSLMRSCACEWQPAGSPFLLCWQLL